MCLVGSSVTVVRAKVEGNIPKKRGAAAAGYDKALSRFFDKVRRHLQPPRTRTTAACLQQSAAALD